MRAKLANWAKNQTFSAEKVHWPSSVEEVQNLVAKSTKAKALGTRHSFNKIADTQGDLISLERLNQVVSLDLSQSAVTVEAGIRYTELSQWLNKEGLALANLASLPHISVGGSLATGTHGSGNSHGILATAVRSFEIVTANGEIKTIQREDPEFPGFAVSLGALGIAVRITLDVGPAFQIAQVLYEDLALRDVLDNLDAIMASAYSVSLFTDWTHSRIDLAWLKHLRPRNPQAWPEEFYGGTIAASQRHPIATASPAYCYPQLGIFGPSHERLPHFRWDCLPSSGEELQSEYLIPRRHAADALMAVHNLKPEIAPILQICEIRTVAADDFWLSPAFDRPCLAVHFTWRKQPDEVAALLPELEKELAPFQARPHWGKLFSVAPKELKALYPKLPEFRALASELDPEGKFKNPFLQKCIF
jgi:xylitol oxidase